jgi:hypothetical protein
MPSERLIVTVLTVVFWAIVIAAVVAAIRVGG